MAGAESIRESASAIAAAQRLVALDAHRGFIMVLMAIDHASYFIARVHSAEFWGIALPVYPNGFWFLTRWITHLCAPGFFFLMGIGMILFADARRQAGWEEGRITRFFVIRGLLLIFLQLFVEDPAWILGDLSAGTGVMVYPRWGARRRHRGYDLSRSIICTRWGYGFLGLHAESVILVHRFD